MRANQIISVILYFFLFLGMQILIFRNVVFFNTAFCFIYIGFILMLPLEIPPLLAMAIAFVFGVNIDIFYSTIGIHAASSVLIAYMRPYIVNALTPAGGYDASVEISVSSLGVRWIVTYAFVLIFIHHFALFSIEAWGFALFSNILVKAIFSTLFTLTVFILFQYLFNSGRK